MATLALIHRQAGDRLAALRAVLDEPGVKSGASARDGRLMDIPAGTAVRFEPGQTREVRLVPYGGRCEVWGFNGQVSGPL